MAVVNFEKGSIKLLKACVSATKRGGIVSILGIHPTLYDNFLVGQFFDKGIIRKGGHAPVQKHIDVLLDHVVDNRVQLDDIITHRLPLTEIAHGYEVFKKKEENCVEVVLNPWA